MLVRTLHSLRAIHTVGPFPPLTIVLMPQNHGSVSTADEMMSKKVDWAKRAGFDVLTEDIPKSFAPYNAVIRISAAGTEDFNRDYLAILRD